VGEEEEEGVEVVVVVVDVEGESNSIILFLACLDRTGWLRPFAFASTFLLEQSSKDQGGKS